MIPILISLAIFTALLALAGIFTINFGPYNKWPKDTWVYIGMTLFLLTFLGTAYTAAVTH